MRWCRFEGGGQVSFGIIEGDRTYDRNVLAADLEAAGLAFGNAAHVRIYKRERRLELWWWLALAALKHGVPGDMILATERELDEFRPGGSDVRR